MDCLFCKIANKEIASEIVYENDKIVAFLDIFPMSLGHTVVIPKKHAENIIDLAGEEVEPLFSAVKEITGLLQEKLAPRGFTIGINHGRVGGQLVDHLHVHIIPRFEGDGGGSLHSVVKNPPKESISEIRDKIIGVE